jgi:hypothetical protein
VNAINNFPISEAQSVFHDVDKIISLGQVKRLKEMFGEKEYATILELGRQAQEGVNLCKRGNLEKGHLKMQSANQTAMKLSENAYQYFHIYYLSCVAYYHFKQKDYKIALASTWQEIEEIEQFEAKGIQTLHYRRSGGRMLNIVKVLFVSGQTEVATKLLLGIFLYVLNGDSSGISKANWNQEKLNIIPYVRQRYIDIIFQQIIEISLDFQGLDEAYFYQNIFSKIPSFEVTNNNLAIINNWLYLQKMYHDGLKNDFILNTIHFCEEPLDSSFDILKLSLISQVIIMAKRTNLNGKIIENWEVSIRNYIHNQLRVNSILKEKVYRLI